MFIPPQGFRHAVTLLLTSRARAISGDASPDAVHLALERLAYDLVALADDTRAQAESTAWLTDEFNRTVDRLPQTFDRAGAKAAGASVLASIASHSPIAKSRDLFLIYVPEDRLPIAAPIAIELTKRRVSVAFSDYEVASVEQFSAAVAKGLAHHRVGAVLATAAFDRARYPLSSTANDRVRVLRSDELARAVEYLAEWAAASRVSKL